MVGSSFESEFNTIINQFNAKVRQLENQGLKFLPKTIDKEEFRKTYQYDQKALKRKLEDLQKFIEPNAERIVQVGKAKITAWELESLKREAQANKSYLTKEINRYGNIVPSIRGKRQAVSYARMGDATYENMRKTRESLDKTKFESQQDLNRYITRVQNLTKRRLTQDYVFKENFIDFIIIAGEKAGLDPDLIDEVVEKMEQMDAHDFYDLYQENEDLKDITEKYSSMKIITGNFTDDDANNLLSDVNFLNEILDNYIGVE